ncbi:hypothetical protein CAPTEDRAFT_193977 [Capitella teleta]|uniref:C2H2-type domain-containing protein n=1 Tax=Capitella teleta TaxID=283909 RepID=R7UJN2_CAPTE|nr:hypothetical protein CAPTEDRAFT_193977 [Capitella teleta]|eukprot:ELU06769.1 hypothetical protein CAPTEDRAFT_193977 [Capitella teleta]
MSSLCGLKSERKGSVSVKNQAQRKPASSWDTWAECFYECVTCGKEFISVNCLHMHMHRMHPDRPEDKQLKPKDPARGASPKPVEEPKPSNDKHNESSQSRKDDVFVIVPPKFRISRQCPICSKDFLSFGYLHAHMRSQHDVDSVATKSDSTKRFPDSETLKMHGKIHSKDVSHGVEGDPPLNTL